MDDGPRPVAQLEVAGDEVRVKVREEHMADPAPEPVSVLEVLRDVALRVDHGRLAALLVGDQVRGMGEAPEVVLLEDHVTAAARSECMDAATSTRRTAPW